MTKRGLVESRGGAGRPREREREKLSRYYYDDRLGNLESICLVRLWEWSEKKGCTRRGTGARGDEAVLLVQNGSGFSHKSRRCLDMRGKVAGGLAAIEASAGAMRFHGLGGSRLPNSVVGRTSQLFQRARTTATVHAGPVACPGR